MGLNLWMPMNGDLHNQGLTNLTVTNTNATINNNGKIGKCYKFAKNAYINIPKEAMTSCTTQASVTLWVKINSWNTNWDTFFQAGLGSTPWTSYTFGLLRNSGNYLTFCISDGSSATQASCKTSNLTLGTWYHIAMVYYTGHILIYVNGSLVQDYATSITPNFNGITSIKLGGLASAYLSDCLLNDVRIYDHALSVKEVEEIAKGLILHYKLDNDGMGNPNLISNTIYSTTAWSTAIQAREIYNDKLAYRINVKTLYQQTNNSADDIFNNTISYKANTRYTLSIDWRDDYRTDSKNSNWRIFITYTDGTTDRITSPANTVLSWQHTTITSAANKTISKIVSSYGNAGEMYFTNLKLEEGAEDTGYSIPYDEMTVIYDSSGYGNNGIITGNLTTDSNSIRYSRTTVFPSGGYIRVEKRPAACLPKEALTVNLWQYSTSWSNPISCTEGGGWNFENSSGIRFPVYISGVGYKVAQSSITPASLNNAWHMLTGTMDKDNIKIYIDGEEAGTVTKGSTNGIGYANNYLFISGEASGNSVTPANSNYTGKLSDVRIYATALTPEQIKELYNTSMSIDDKGNIHVRELVEL